MRSGRVWLGAALGLGLTLLAVPPVRGDDPEQEKLAAHAAASAASAASAAANVSAMPEETEGTTDARSIGWVYRGQLEDGELLSPSPVIHHVERFADGGRFFGTPAMVGLLERAAARVAATHGAARLNVGELSQEGGGDVVGHRSHENGRDADVGFYIVDGEGASVEPTRFVRIGRSGHGSDGEQRVTFDTARNWTFIESLVTDEASPVQMIFVAPSLKRRLIRHARARRVDPEIVERAEWTMVPPEGVARHDDHFHIRIYCAPDEREVCEDRGPYWQWTPASHVPEEVELLPRFWSHD